MDITAKESVKLAFKKYQPDLVVQLAAYTDVAKAEYEKKLCWKTNVYGTELISRRSSFLIYISTEYVFDGEKGNYHEFSVPNPLNFYALSKLAGEWEAQKARKYCIIRTLFKPRPYKHELVPCDMWTSGDYVDVIAKKIYMAIRNYDILPKIMNIGTDRKCLYDLASQTRQVKPSRRNSLPIKLPRDTSLDTTLFQMMFERKK
jgi:dTDP-4-dehydrorhamnose reductase